MGECRGEHVRGYKLRADGSKTTFFNNDLSEADRALIGDIAPKRLDSAAVAKGAGAPGMVGDSAWNHAGTFEEKDRTVWATQRLAKMLAEVSAPVAHGFSGSICVEKVEGIKGDASVVSVKGKRKHIASFEFSVHWTALIECVDIKSSASGVIFFPDFQSDTLDDIEWEKKGIEQVEQSAARKAVDAGVKGLAAAVQAALRNFMDEFSSN